MVMRWIAVLVALLLAAPTFASTLTNTKVSGQGTVLFTFAAADTTANDSDLFTASSFFTACFDPDTGGVAGTGAVIVRRCGTNTKPAANPHFSCISTGGANGNANLDGTEGPKTTQNACERYAPGHYYIDIVTQCGGNNCRVTLQGEQD